MTAERRSATDWSLQIAILVVTSVLILQNTKGALLPARETPVLWGAEAAVLASMLLLRSGWGRDTHWAAQQGELGTLANNYYPPRREALINGGAIAVGIFAALWWAAAAWSVMFYGMRRGVPGRGIVDFVVAALVGAITGGFIGAVLGLAVGHLWEGRHRRRRLARQASHA